MKYLIIALALFSNYSFASEEEAINQLRALDWKKAPADYQIAHDKAIIKTTENDYLVTGDDAAEYMFIMQGHRGYKPDAAIYRVQGPEASSQVIYTVHKIGFVTKDDWKDSINKDSILQEIRNETNKNNEKVAPGYPKNFVDSWVQPPHLDKTNNTVYWAIAGHDDRNTKFINAKALKLGREGYTEVVWIGSPEQFSSAEASLKPILANYNYKEGFQYDDYIPGSDKIAAAGVGALVYKLVTGKAAAQAGFLAIAAIFAKKFWFLIFLPFAYVWKWIKRRFIDPTKE